MTPEQWERRKELTRVVEQKAREREADERAFRDRLEAEKRARMRREEAVAVERADRAAAEATLQLAREWEGAKDPGKARKFYQQVIDRYPNSTAAEAARKQISALPGN
jgi:hypothetical protein